MHSSAQKHLRVLMLERSHGDAELLERELHRHGLVFSARHTDKWDTFIQSLTEFQPNVILAECNLPEFDSMAALKAVQHNHPEIPVIMISDTLSEGQIMEWIRAGAKDYVLKSQLSKLPLAVLHVLTVEERIRERKSAEQEVREGKELFQSIAASAQDAIILVNNDGNLAYWNAAAERIFGYTAAEAMGKELHGLLAPSRYLDDYKRGFAQFRETGIGPAVGQTLELEAVRKDGTEFPIELSVSAVTIKGKWHGVGILRDISARKHDIEELRSSRNLLHSIIENAPIRVFWKDRECRYLGCNTTFAHDAGLSKPDDLIDKDDFQMGWHEQADLYRADDKLVMDSGNAKIGYEEPQTTPDGRTIWLRTSKVPLRDKEGIVIGMLGIYDDITEEKNNQVRLKKSLDDLEEAQHLAHIGSWRWTVPTDTIFWSPEYYRIYQNDPTQPTPNYAEHLKVYTAESANRLNASVKQAVELGEPYALELELAKPDVAGKWILARGSAKRDSHGNVVELYGTAQDITERKQAELVQKKLTRALMVLSSSNRTLVYAENEQDLLAAICKLVVEQAGYQLAWVGYAEQDENHTVHLVAKASDDDDESYLDNVNISWADNERGHGPTGMAIRTRTVQVNQNFQTNPAIAPWREAALKHGYQSSIALPLAQDHLVFGALTIYAKEPDAFSPEESALLEELAGDLAFGITSLRVREERNLAIRDREQYADRLRASLESALAAIATTVEMRDPYTAGHQRRVADLTVAIARDMKLPEDRIHGLALAATVHDLGKIQIPAEILSRPGRLSEIEFALVKAHSQTGYEILKGIPFPWPIAQAVLQHHERLDGSGYPAGLKNGQIILEARILTVADIVEAISSHRPYRPALGIDTALQEIQKNRGKFYDAAVVDSCVKLFTSDGYQLPAA